MGSRILRRVVLIVVSAGLLAACGPHPQGAVPSTHHNEPFLVCTRAHESDTAGGYRAVDPAGVHFGAYQFKQSTWDNTARHAGWPWLVGVRPDRATVQEQDDMAWHLYIWQGKAPWGGRC